MPGTSTSQGQVWGLESISADVTPSPHQSAWFKTWLLRGSRNGSRSRVPATHRGNLDWVPGFCPALPWWAFWGVNQHKGVLS